MEKGQTIIFTCGKDNRSKWNRRKETHLLCPIKILNRLQYEVHPSALIRYTNIMFMWVLKCVNYSAVCTKVFHLWICQANVVSMLVLVVPFYIFWWKSLNICFPCFSSGLCMLLSIYCHKHEALIPLSPRTDNMFWLQFSSNDGGFIWVVGIICFLSYWIPWESWNSKSCWGFTLLEVYDCPISVLGTWG